MYTKYVKKWHKKKAEVRIMEKKHRNDQAANKKHLASTQRALKS